MDPLSKSQVGQSQLQVTRLGLGGTALGGLYRDLPEDTADETIRRAFELGVPFFDSAPLYGSGKSESRLGRALAGRSRDSYVLASKAGYALVPQEQIGDRKIFFPFDNAPPMRPIFDFSYDGAMRSFAGSLGRLGVDSIDILHIHDPDEHLAEVMQGAYLALDKLRRQGAIRAIGLGTTSVETLITFAQAMQLDCVLLAGRYTLLDCTALSQALPLCLKKGISVIIGGPYSSGILATGAVAGATFNYVPATPEVLERVRRIENICREYSVPLKAAALQFPLAHPAVISIIPGARTAGEVEENFRMVQHAIPDEFWTELQRNGLLPSEAPVHL